MNKYQTILNKEYQGRLWIFFGLILFIIIMIVFLVVITRKISDKKERIITLIVIATLILMLTCLAGEAIREALAIKKIWMTMLLLYTMASINFTKKEILIIAISMMEKNK